MRAPDGTRVRGVAMCGALGLLVVLAACDPLGGGELSNTAPPASHVTAWHPTGSDASTADALAAYAVMCRHYCDALFETNLYDCLSDARTAGSCSPPPDDLCVEDRCVARLVPPALCFTQCDALDRAYRATCGGADGGADGGAVASAPPSSADECALSPDAHDALCRDGCQLPTES
ncbi:MAG TPA: hypothetical protein VHM31_23275 [Polyangia bacterium]|nr:hypothetical protein [Polyangia bacterium]